MERRHPYRFTIIVTIICVIVVLIVGVYVKQQTTPANTTQLASISADSTSSSSQTDIGTSTNWQEQFFNVATGTVPKVGTKAAEATTSEPLTLTDRLSRDFFAHYIELKQADLTTDGQTVAAAMNQTINNTVEAAPSAKVYSMGDVVISPNASPTDIHSYGNSISTIFASYSPRADATSIATDALNSNDMSVLVNIDPIVSAYDKMIKVILLLPVPKPLAQSHLDFINGLSLIRFVSSGLRNIATDPMQTMVAVGQYVPAQSAIRDALISMRDYFNTNNITFTTNEPGIMFSTVQ